MLQPRDFSCDAKERWGLDKGRARVGEGALGTGTKVHSRYVGKTKRSDGRRAGWQGEERR